MASKPRPDFSIAIVGAGYVLPPTTCSTLRAYLGSKLWGARRCHRPEEKMEVEQLCGEIACTSVAKRVVGLCTDIRTWR